MHLHLQYQHWMLLRHFQNARQMKRSNAKMCLKAAQIVPLIRRVFMERKQQLIAPY